MNISLENIVNKIKCNNESIFYTNKLLLVSFDIIINIIKINIRIDS